MEDCGEGNYASQTPKGSRSQTDQGLTLHPETQSTTIIRPYTPWRSQTREDLIQEWQDEFFGGDFEDDDTQTQWYAAWQAEKLARKQKLAGKRQLERPIVAHPSAAKGGPAERAGFAGGKKVDVDRETVQGHLTREDMSIAAKISDSFSSVERRSILTGMESRAERGDLREPAQNLSQLENMPAANSSAPPRPSSISQHQLGNTSTAEYSPAPRPSPIPQHQPDLPERSDQQTQDIDTEATVADAAAIEDGEERYASARLSSCSPSTALDGCDMDSLFDEPPDSGAGSSLTTPAADCADNQGNMNNHNNNNVSYAEQWSVTQNCGPTNDQHTVSAGDAHGTEGVDDQDYMNNNNVSYAEQWPATQKLDPISYQQTVSVGLTHGTEGISNEHNPDEFDFEAMMEAGFNEYEMFMNQSTHDGELPQMPQMDITDSPTTGNSEDEPMTPNDSPTNDRQTVSIGAGDGAGQSKRKASHEECPTQQPATKRIRPNNNQKQAAPTTRSYKPKTGVKSLSRANLVAFAARRQIGSFAGMTHQPIQPAFPQAAHQIHPAPTQHPPTMMASAPNSYHTSYMSSGSPMGPPPSYMPSQYPSQQNFPEHMNTEQSLAAAHARPPTPLLQASLLHQHMPGGFVAPPSALGHQSPDAAHQPGASCDVPIDVDARPQVMNQQPANLRMINLLPLKDERISVFGNISPFSNSTQYAMKHLFATFLVAAKSSNNPNINSITDRLAEAEDNLEFPNSYANLLQQLHEEMSGRGIDPQMQTMVNNLCNRIQNDELFAKQMLLVILHNRIGDEADNATWIDWEKMTVGAAVEKMKKVEAESKRASINQRKKMKAMKEENKKLKEDAAYWKKIAQSVPGAKLETRGRKPKNKLAEMVDSTKAPAGESVPQRGLTGKR